MEDIKAIEDEVSRLMGLNHTNSYYLEVYFDYAFLTLVFIWILLMSKSLEGVWIVVGIWITLMLVIHLILHVVYRFKRASVKKDDKPIDEFCKFLLEQEIYLQPLITKYLVIEKEKNVKNNHRHNTIFTTIMSATTIFLSVMSAFRVNRFSKADSLTGIFFLGLVIWLYAILIAPGVGYIWERVSDSTDKLQNETIELLEGVEIRIIKEELSEAKKQSIERVDDKVFEHHPRKGY